MFNLVEISLLEKSIHSLFLIAVILLVRRYFNEKSIKWANFVLWTILLVYLLSPYGVLINIEELKNLGVSDEIIKSIVSIRSYSKLITVELGGILSGINRVSVTTLISIYVIYQTCKMKKALKYSTYPPKNSTIDYCINFFNLKRKIQVLNLKRKIQVLVNDDIKVPVTYGIIRPKIIIQSRILNDDELLKYVLIHELTHIKKFDILFSHIKNLITCIYWYNLFIIVASRYMEDDIEYLCDKLVIQKIGDTTKNRKEYSVSMLKLMEEKEESASFALKLNPTHERIKVMKKWKKSLAGVMSFAMVAIMSTTVFADVDKSVENIVVTDEVSSIEETSLNNEDIDGTSIEQIRVITDEEYNALELGENLLKPTLKPFSANFDESETLGGLSNKQYPFDMKSWTEANHNAFAIKITDMSCKQGIKYQVIVQKNGNTIYSENFSNGKNITIENAQNNSKYNVIVNNLSTNSLKYNITINSYLKK